MSKTQSTIDEIIPIKKHKQNPIVAYFQNGQMTDNFAANLDVCTVKDSTNKILLAISKDNIYDGYIDHSSLTKLNKTFLAIRKKKSEKVKLVEVSESSMMSYIYKCCFQQESKLSNVQSDMHTENARRILFKEFGGKKAIQVLDRKEKMKINVDVVKEQLDKTLLELDINQSTKEHKDEFDEVKEQQDNVLEEMLPKVNKDAIKLTDVYCLENLIQLDILDSLKADAINLLKASHDDIPIRPIFLKIKIQSIQRARIPDEIENLRKIEICIYIDALISFLKQINQVHLNSVVRLKPLSKITSKLDSHIKKKFAQPNIVKLTKTNYVIHKTTLYIIVLSLLISERLEIDIQHIIEEIGVSKTSLLKILSSTAVRPKAKSNIICIRLPSQLKAFSTNFRRRLCERCYSQFSPSSSLPLPLSLLSSLLSDNSLLLKSIASSSLLDDHHG
ncbi:uncharacterized protein LOC116350183 isoform X3 [Contarinia nasturtii]|uniref:uncharacterized protein LOC116350183 isoform X3 n=1 Tax=Contarinia nasturtii TaxID=265458 RepID=UPI0012D38395|nr:uncharacterized protein LOC116350183 isoform X3 [Contarinia nasturtii]